MAKKSHRRRRERSNYGIPYLVRLVFNEPPQVKFAEARYGEFDGAVVPYGSDLGSSRKTSTGDYLDTVKFNTSKP